MKNKYGFSEQEQEQINNIVRHFGIINYSKNLNKVEIQGIESLNHFLAKSKICYFLKQKKMPFITETKIGQNIPDILVLKPLQGIEILHSETEKQFDIKVDKSPYGLILVKVHSHDVEEMENIDKLL